MAGGNARGDDREAALKNLSRRAAPAQSAAHQRAETELGLSEMSKEMAFRDVST